MRRFSVLPLLLLLVAAAAWTLGCGDDKNTTTGPEDSTGWVAVLMTDAPSDYIDTAMVRITRVYLLPDSSDSTGPVDLLPEEDGPLTFDLMQLRDGLTAFLGQAPAPAGDYGQLRMVVDSAWVSLVDSVLFDDGSNWANLKVPSGNQSGIKVKLEDPIPAEEGTVTIVTVDFDVDDNFKLQGNPETPAGVKGVIFTPVLKEKGRSQEPDDEDDGIDPDDEP